MKEKVYNLIVKEPGLHKKDIGKKLGIYIYDLDFIIKDLVKEGKIVRYYEKMNDIRYKVKELIKCKKRQELVMKSETI